MSVGLLALLDDVGALAKVAAASLDDAAGQAARAGAKAAGVVIDDTAVAPAYVIGLDASRELPIVGKIALGSLKNKLLYLLPAALVLDAAAPWAVTPMLTAGGAYLCFEGAEKVWGMWRPHPGRTPPTLPGDARALEDARVRSAIQTDFILSAEIMAVTLGSVADSPIWEQAPVLAIVGLGITGAVYGVVALLVKADDAGVWLARRPGAPVRAAGRALVAGMPVLLAALGLAGTAAMLWVGGGIVVHGLEQFGAAQPAHWIEHASGAAAGAPGFGGALGWAAGAAVSGAIGLVLGLALIPVMTFIVTPAMALVNRRRGRWGAG